MRIIKLAGRIAAKSSTSLLFHLRMQPRLMSLLQQVLLILICVIFSNAASSDLLVVTRTDTAISSLSVEQLSGLWLGKFSRVEDTSLEVIDINEKSPLRAILYEKVLGLSDRQLKSYWAIAVFRGNGFPPRMVATETDVKQWVLERPNRIGYLSTEDNDPLLKVLYRLKEEGRDE
ncbi:MAG: hypothetical protein QGD92_09615 [Gammaproteobacteria bacterium]|nr:hypothetical protein [Gammaproteobacteria bacterium]